MARRTKQAAAVALAAALAGCSNKLPEAQPVVKRAALQSFTDCASLEDYIEDNAVLDMRSQLELQRDGYGGGWRGFGGPEMMADAAAPNAAGGATANSAAPSAYTTTNTQVAGVDEADFVKNDGTRIFVLSGNKLYSTLSWPASALALQGKLELEGHPREMFLDGDTVVVFSGVYQSYPLDSGNGGGSAGGAAPSADIAVGPSYGYTNATKVTVVDVSNLAQPVATRAYYLPGDYANSRRVGQSVRLVLRGSSTAA